MKTLAGTIFLVLTTMLNTIVAQTPEQPVAVMRISLEDAKNYARENNYDIINATKDIEIARQRVRETTAIGLPQLSGAIAYNDFINIPTQLIPGEFFDEPAGSFIPVKFGTQYNMSVSGTLSQLIFSGEYIVGLQAARAFVDFSNKQFDKITIELEYIVAESYYLTLVAKRNIGIVESTLESLNEIRQANELLFENGFIEDIEVDQIRLLISDLEASLMDIKNNYNVSMNFLKFQMGLKLETQIELTDQLDDHLALVDQQLLLGQNFDYRLNIDYQILQNQQELAFLDLRRNQSLYLPRLSAFVNYSENAQRNAWDFFDGSKDWYRTTIFGVQMDIPIFESGNRSARVKQKKIQLEQLQVLDEQLQTGLDIEYNTRRNNFLNAWRVHQNKQQGLEIAQKIYDRTRMKTLEGVATSIELQQTYNQYLNSESDYVMSMLQLFRSKLELEKLMK